MSPYDWYWGSNLNYSYNYYRELYSCFTKSSFTPRQSTRVFYSIVNWYDDSILWSVNFEISFWFHDVFFKFTLHIIPNESFPITMIYYDVQNLHYLLSYQISADGRNHKLKLLKTVILEIILLVVSNINSVAYTFDRRFR